jgi:plastocyanin
MTTHRDRDAERLDERGNTHWMTQMQRFIRHIGSLAVVAAISGCGSSSAPMQTGGGNPGFDATVDATPAIAFTPSNVTVTVGETVKFAFGSVAHNVYFDASPAGAPADITGSNANKSVTRTFNTLGVFEYDCHIHPGMRGTITVIAER